MIERRQRLGLALEPRQALGVSRERVGQDLDGDLAAERRFGRSPHLPHSAFADRRDDFVDADAGAGSQGHEGDTDYIDWEMPCEAVGRLLPKQRAKSIDTHPRGANERSQGAGREFLVLWNGETGRMPGLQEHHVAATLPIDLPARACERAHGITAGNHGQSRH
ncbi:MAG: hypothetical protein RJA55_347 [Acidobacteriota bacterium]|jgi:hypothetical protein